LDHALLFCGRSRFMQLHGVGVSPTSSKESTRIRLFWLSLG
jgi:hypothetical protein